MSPPYTAASGELWLVHQSGAFLKLLNDGSISGKATQFNLTGTVSITGDLVVSGNITDANGMHGTLGAFRSAYDAHTHAAGGSTTSVPSKIV